jgi:hypothetical protein
MFWSRRMSEDRIKNPTANNHGGYEREDLSPTGVFYFMGGLALVTVAIYFIVFGMYRFLDTYEKAHQPAMSPMVTPPVDTRVVTDTDTQAFPGPRLEKDEGTNFRESLENQDRKLATYDWVDQDKGIVQIPIDRAMELIVERGLPVRSENSPPEGSAGAQTSAPARQTRSHASAANAGAHGN